MAYRKKNGSLYSILILVCIVGFWLFENFYTPATYSENEEGVISNEFPKELLPSSTTGEIVNHEYFTLSYNEPYEQAEWVAYTLSKSHLTYDDRKRPYFIEDPFVSSKSADWRNYKGSGYDRGHLLPAGDRRFSLQAYNETFYTSNISPQDREFNSGIWNDLEQQTRRWAKQYGTLYIFTGGVLESGLEEIGQEDVDVPNAFYKIIARKKGDKIYTLSFLMPNKPQFTSLRNFVVSIDEIEKETGIDFFTKLTEKQQSAFEGSKNTTGWKF
ncbi:DNA/RNA non-specific endonuclease [Maribacter sp. 1_MG-2023]|uniref:DNA/RNA non-specific endonuclease n=1 Tax=Maribacter sp. 1_MG-2023 TaxID=3062677 RepID=UPI0026E3085E|nr:DNA/RNA non-specific endonuclease [Maribacter sp. 1_MG-2023]MDO6473136.1 DNA/RNA non-specific endonuclease [Maribacter sp. 1_MG-2023]